MTAEKEDALHSAPAYKLSPGIQPTSRFTPTEQGAAERVAAANQRADRLALRILAAERAIKQGQPSGAVLSILGGAHDG